MFEVEMESLDELGSLNDLAKRTAKMVRGGLTRPVAKGAWLHNVVVRSQFDPHMRESYEIASPDLTSARILEGIVNERSRIMQQNGAYGRQFVRLDEADYSVESSYAALRGALGLLRQHPLHPAHIEKRVTDVCVEQTLNMSTIRGGQEAGDWIVRVALEDPSEPINGGALGVRHLKEYMSITEDGVIGYGATALMPNRDIRIRDALILTQDAVR